MSANCLADMMCFLKGGGRVSDEDLVKDAVKKAEKLWQKLEEKGYCSELDVVASSDGNCDTP
jgi:ribosomal protein S8